MAPLGALSQAWTSAEASLPLGWKVSGLWHGLLQECSTSISGTECHVMTPEP